jgi:hypothetical protein
MPSYHVIWEIDIDAEDPSAAAKMAREIQLDDESIATVFGVAEVLPNGLRTGYIPVDVAAGEIDHVH